MSDASFSVVPIFATPFAVLTLPEAEKLNAAVTGILMAQAAATPGAHGSNPLCYIGRDDLLDSAAEPLRSLNAEILRGVSSVAAAVNDFTAEQFHSLAIQARGWFSIVRPDGGLPAVSYPLTSWCGIYCLEAPQVSSTRRDSGVLRLYEARLGTMFSDATNATMRIPFAPGHYTWRPVPGQLAVFPACITHEIAPIRAAGQLTIVTVRVRFVAPGQKGWARW